jgi:hypothetical protein
MMPSAPIEFRALARSRNRRHSGDPSRVAHDVRPNSVASPDRPLEHLVSVLPTAIGCYDRRRPHRAEPRVGRDPQPPTEGLSRWPNSPKP